MLINTIYIHNKENLKKTLYKNSLTIWIIFEIGQYYKAFEIIVE